MKYLLDTSVFLLADASPERLNRQARDLLSHEREGIYLSAASSWEISIKHALGKLELPGPAMKYVPQRLRELGLQALDITHVHALATGELPWHHQDPFDRLLIIQARLEQMVLLTSDRVFEKYAVKTLWCGR